MKKKLILILSMLALMVSIMVLSIGATSVKFNEGILFKKGLWSDLPINQEYVVIDGVDTTLTYYYQGIANSGFNIDNFKAFVDDCLDCEPGQANNYDFVEFVFYSYDPDIDTWCNFTMYVLNFKDVELFNYYYHYDESVSNAGKYTEEDLKLEYEKGKIAGQTMASSTDVESGFDYTTLLPSILTLVFIALIFVFLKQKRKKK